MTFHMLYLLLKCDAIGHMVGQIHVELGVGHLELGKAVGGFSSKCSV